MNMRYRLRYVSNNDYHPGLEVVDTTLPATGISLSEWIFVGNRNPSTKEIIKIMTSSRLSRN
jgi:hypothetical protein